MKAKNSVSIKTVLTVLSVALTCLSLSAFADGDGGHGGAGCNQGGDLRSLFYCGAYHDTPMPPPKAPPAFEAPLEVAGLQNFISNLSYLLDSTKQDVLMAITPSYYHRYVSVATAPDLTAPVVARIKSEFSRATGLDAKRLDLYAVTRRRCDEKIN